MADSVRNAIAVDLQDVFIGAMQVEQVDAILGINPAEIAQESPAGRVDVDTEAAAADDQVNEFETPADAAAVNSKAESKYEGDLESLHCNTPTKTRQSSSVWTVVKRIPTNAREQYAPKTHVCTAIDAEGQCCRQLLRLTKVKEKTAGSSASSRNWQTSLAMGHVRLWHQESTAAGAESLKRKEKTMEAKASSMFAQGMNQVTGGGGLARYTLTYAERALTSQARWYIYSPMHIRYISTISSIATSTPISLPDLNPIPLSASASLSLSTSGRCCASRPVATACT